VLIVKKAMSRTRAHFILASNSPRRQELLGVLGVPFTIRVAPVDETELPDETPAAMVGRLAQCKARAAELGPGELLLAADTTVELDGKVLGKPVDEADAHRMLEALRGRPHTVHSAIVLRAAGREHVELVTTAVIMRPYTKAELAAYLASGSPMDKAGAYGIQDEPFAPCERIAGCYLNVMGLPLCHVARALLAWGVALPHLPPPYCAGVLGYACPVALFD
jgi:septum formation protein